MSILRRSQDVSEDDRLEVNPYAFIDEDDKKETLQVLRVPYSSKHFLNMIDKRFYMGHRFKMMTDFRQYKKGSPYKIFDAIKPVKQDLPVDYRGESEVQVQSFEPYQGDKDDKKKKLLDIPNYVMSRVYDFAESLILSKDIEEDVEIRTVESLAKETLKRKLVERNMKTFLYNNSWSFYSDSKEEEVKIFCPIFCFVKDDITGEKIYIMKFLRLNPEGTSIYPYIYMIQIPNIRDRLLHLRISGFNQPVNFYLKLASSPQNNEFFPYYYFYNPETKDYHGMELPNNNPDDCVVVTMFLCGLLPQPDLTRYHNMFRYVIKNYDPVSKEGYFEQGMSHGYTTSIEKIVTRRVLNLYNRENPDRPKKQISTLRVYLPGCPYNLENDLQAGRLKKKIMLNGYPTYISPNEDLYSIQGYEQGKTLAENILYVNQIFKAFKCNQPLAFIPIGVEGHQLQMYYNETTDKFLIYEAQVNEEYDFNNLDHPNYTSAGGNFEGFIEFFVMKTSQNEIRVPEFYTLFEYFRQTHSYRGDIFPIIRSGLTNYVSQMIKGVYQLNYDPIQPVFIQLLENPLSHPLFQLSEQTIKYEELTDLLQNFTENKLVLLRNPMPEISFNRVNQIEEILSSAIENLSTFAGLKKVRGFVNFFLAAQEEVIETYLKKLVSRFSSYGKYSGRELNEILYSRTVFSSILTEYLEKYPIKSLYENASRQIALYLSNQTKPVLKIVQLYMKIKELARLEGNEKYFIRYLSRYRTRTLSDLLQLSNKLKAINTEESLPEQIYSVIKELNQAFLLQQKGLILATRQYAITEYAKQLASSAVITPRVIEAYIKREKEREVQEYLLEVAQDNEERRRQGIPEEKPDKKEIQNILKKVVVTEDLIEEVRSGGSRVRKLGPAREGVLLAKSYIKDYIQDLSERKEEEFKQEFGNKKLEEWPPEAIRLVREETRRVLTTYIKDEDNVNALNVFVTVMNIVKSTTRLSERYLGKR